MTSRAASGVGAGGPQGVRHRRRLAMALSFVVKTWLFQAFYIPSGSMENTLVLDDRVIVGKLTPGPLDLKRGDVVVFEDPGVPTPWLAGLGDGQHCRRPVPRGPVFVGLLPEDSENHLIKRVIGLPGDHVSADGDPARSGSTGSRSPSPTSSRVTRPSEGKQFNITVPAGHVWVMGDHRSDSSDSRFHDDGTGANGSVPIDKLVGRALFIVWPIDHVTWLGVPERTFAQVPRRASTPANPAQAGREPTAPRRRRRSRRADGARSRCATPSPLQEAVPAGRARPAAFGPPPARRHGRGRPRRPRRPRQRRRRRHRRDRPLGARSASRTPSC